MIKKYILSILIAFSIPLGLAFSATPILSTSGNGDGSNVSVTITGGEANTVVALYFNSTQDGALHSQVIGTTNSAGSFSGTVTSSGIGVTPNTPVYAMINGYSSNSVTWPYYNVSTQSQMTLSQNNPTIQIGQSGTLTISGGTGSYYIASNQNTGIIGATISGNMLTYSGLGNGSSLLSICSSSGNICTSTTISTNSSSNGALQLTPSVLNLSPGQSGMIQVSGGNGTYTATTISGDNLIYYSSGNTLTFTGTINGTRTINICSTNNLCSILTANISGTYNNNTLTFSPSSINLTANQAGTVQISGGTGNYTVSTVSGDPLYTSISGNTLTINSTTNGTRSLVICSPSTSCNTLSVTVGGASQSNQLGFSLPLAINQIVKLTVTGGNSSSYYLQSAVSYPITANISGNILTVSGSTYGTSVATICQSGNTVCLPITFVVNQPGTGNVGTGGPYTFNNDLWYGQTNSEVGELQRFLIGENYLSSGVTGYFGTLTLSAVKKYQSANGISMTGYVGPLTRTALNN